MSSQHKRLSLVEGSHEWYAELIPSCRGVLLDPNGVPLAPVDVEVVALSYLFEGFFRRYMISAPCQCAMWSDCAKELVGITLVKDNAFVRRRSACGASCY